MQSAYTEEGRAPNRRGGRELEGDGTGSEDEAGSPDTGRSASDFVVADEHFGFGTVCESHPCYLCPPGAESIHLDLTSPRGHERADGRVKLQVDWHRIDYLATPIEEFDCAIVIEGHAVGSMSSDCRR